MTDDKRLCVLLPGLDGSGLLFDDFIKNTADYLQHIIISYPNNKIMSYEELAEYIHTKLPPEQKYFILAESFSGPAGILVAHRKPKNLQSLILVATFSSSPFGKLSAIANVLLNIFGKLPMPAFVINSFLINGKRRDIAKLASSIIKKTDRDVLISRVKNVLSCNVEKQLNDIEIPILSIRPENDRILPKIFIKKMAINSLKIVTKFISAPHFVLQVEPLLVSETVIKPFIFQQID